MARRGFAARAARAVLWLLLGFVAFTSLQVLTLRWVDPWTSAFMVDARIDAWRADRPFKLRYRWADLEQMSPHVPMAVVASEDQRFAQHAGFDFEAIRKAAEHNARSKRTRGASTISQQLAKNLFLWPERSWVRKGLEAWYTLLIEALLPKRRILELYVNVAEFGPGIYGAEAAAQAYWGKPAKKLTRAEAATLAAVLPSPRKYNAKRPSAFVQAQRERILRQMRTLEAPDSSEDVPRTRETN